MAGAVPVVLLAPPPRRQQHGNAAAILAIGVAERGDQVALLKCCADQNVPCHANRKQEMAERHHGRAPHRQQEPEIDRMAHQIIEQRGLEHSAFCSAPAQWS